MRDVSVIKSWLVLLSLCSCKEKGFQASCLCAWAGRAGTAARDRHRVGGKKKIYLKVKIKVGIGDMGRQWVSQERLCSGGAGGLLSGSPPWAPRVVTAAGDTRQGLPRFGDTGATGVSGSTARWGHPARSAVAKPVSSPLQQWWDGPRGDGGAQPVQGCGTAAPTGQVSSPDGLCLY